MSDLEVVVNNSTSKYNIERLHGFRQYDLHQRFKPVPWWFDIQLKLFLLANLGVKLPCRTNSHCPIEFIA